MNQAVLIGLNVYAKQKGLNGCINDVDDFYNHLTKANAVDASNIVKLLDAAATKAAIIKSLKDMVGKLKGGDRAWIHFSCHGVQLPTTDVNEPDGLDEVLCPYEFDWTPETSITDNELVQILANVTANAQITVTVDSCHSGDESRDLKPIGSQPRTIPPPEHIRLQVASGRRPLNGGFRMLRSILQVGFASACSPWQEAADAPFENGRYNGAFSYYFLKQAVANPQITIAELVVGIEPPLQVYDMTPVSESAVGIPYSSSMGRRSLSTLPLGQAIAIRSATTVFEQQFSATVIGQPLAVKVLIAASNGALDVYLTLSGFGMSMPVPPMRIDGDMSVPIPLNMLGLQLVFRVTGYAIESQVIRFNIVLDVTTSIIFVPSVRVAQVAVEVPTSAFTRNLSLSTAPGSASELVALLTLQNLGKEMQDPLKTNVAPQIGPRSIKKRSILGKVLEIKSIRCIGAEAIFGDTIDVYFGGSRIINQVVNTNGYYPFGQTYAIPEGGSDLRVVQYYFGQGQQEILSKRINPDEPSQVTDLTINPGDDGDPGGKYVISIEINDRLVN